MSQACDVDLASGANGDRVPNAAIPQAKLDHAIVAERRRRHGWASPSDQPAPWIARSAC